MKFLLFRHILGKCAFGERDWGLRTWGPAEGRLTLHLHPKIKAACPPMFYLWPGTVQPRTWEHIADF